MNKKAYILAIAVVAMMVGCSEPEPIYVKKPNPWNEEATLTFTSEKSTTVDSQKQEVVFNFESSMDQFEIKTDRAWCTAKVVDNNKLVVEVEKNEFSNNRVATITIVAGVYDNIPKWATSTAQALSIGQAPRLPMQVSAPSALNAPMVWTHNGASISSRRV